MIGERRDRANNQVEDSPDQTDRETSFRAGVIANLGPRLAPYLGYSESFLPIQSVPRHQVSLWGQQQMRPADKRLRIGLGVRATNGATSGANEAVVLDGEAQRLRYPGFGLVDALVELDRGPGRLASERPSCSTAITTVAALLARPALQATAAR